MTAQPAEGWIPEDSLALRLFLVRKQLGLSQRQAALKTGVSYGSWQSMEDGRQARGVDTKVAKICAALGVDREWLMWGGPLAPDGEGHSLVTVEYLSPTFRNSRASRRERRRTGLRLVPTAAPAAA